MSMSEDSGDERGGGSEDSAGDERMHEPSRTGRDTGDSRSGGGRSVPIPMRRPPLPTFGSNNSLSSMIGTSPGGNGRTPPVAGGVRVRSSPVPRPTFGSFTSLVEMEDEMEDARLGARRKEATYGHEITVATGDRQGLLKYMTSALSDFHLELNIRVSVADVTVIRCGSNPFIYSRRALHSGNDCFICVMDVQLYAALVSLCWPERCCISIVGLSFVDILLVK